MLGTPAPIAPGDIVSGLEPAELVEVQRLSPFGGKTLVEGVGVQTRRLIRRPLSAEDLGALVKVRGQRHAFDGDPRAFLLGIEADRIRIAHQFDPLFAVNSSIVDPLPRQVEADYRKNPIPQLHPEMLYRQVQYLVEETDWAACGSEVAV